MRRLIRKLFWYRENSSFNSSDCWRHLKYTITDIAGNQYSGLRPLPNAWWISMEGELYQSSAAGTIKREQIASSQEWEDAHRYWEGQQ